MVLQKCLTNTDGNVLRCEGSPFRGERKRSTGSGYENFICENCSQDRIYQSEKDLIESGELSKISYEVPKQKEKEVIIRSLFIKTYQNDNFYFTEYECDIDAILKKLDDDLAG